MVVMQTCLANNLSNRVCCNYVYFTSTALKVAMTTNIIITLLLTLYLPSEIVGCTIERMLRVNTRLKVLDLSHCKLDTAVSIHIATGPHIAAGH